MFVFERIFLLLKDTAFSFKGGVASVDLLGVGGGGGKGFRVLVYGIVRHGERYSARPDLLLSVEDLQLLAN